MHDCQRDLERKLGCNPETHRAYRHEDYAEDMTKAMAGDGGELARIGLPRPMFNVSGFLFLLLLPVFALWFVTVDLLYGWRRWRMLGVLAALLVAAGMLGVLVFGAVQAETGGAYAMSEDSPTFALIENICAGGVAAVLFFLFPRTVIALALLGGAISFLAWLL